MFKLRLTLPFLFFLVNPSAELFSSDTINLEKRYSLALDSLSHFIASNSSFKKAAFVTENVYYNGNLSYTDYEYKIELLKSACSNQLKNSSSKHYRFNDDANYLTNYAIFSIFRDTVLVKITTGRYHYYLKKNPLSYNFNDPLGNQDWSSTFISTLLNSNNGNCRSLVYLYKILADEFGARCWMSLAPNHIYIRNYSEKTGWYNTELTSHTFPTDAWIMATGYVSPEAIRSGLYMDTLSNQQAMALCVLDLAKGYEFQTRNYYDGFILKCCDLVLQYHPSNPMALLLKAETLKKIYLKEQADKVSNPSVTFIAMQEAYVILATHGYREMSEKMYKQWLKAMTPNKSNFTNKRVPKPPVKK